MYCTYPFFKNIKKIAIKVLTLEPEGGHPDDQRGTLMTAAQWGCNRCHRLTGQPFLVSSSSSDTLHRILTPTAKSRWDTAKKVNFQKKLMFFPQNVNSFWPDMGKYHKALMPKYVLQNVKNVRVSFYNMNVGLKNSKKLTNICCKNEIM